MASYFGEVLSLDSRAVDDEDCIEEDGKRPQLIVDLQDVVYKTPSEVIVCAIGRSAVAFVSSYIRSDDAEFVGSAKIKMPESEDNYSGFVYPKEPKPVAKFYLLNSLLICEVSEDVIDELCFDFSQCVVNIPSNSNTECIVFSSLHSSSYRSSEEHNQNPFLRCLYTSAYRDVVLPAGIVYLEPPNFVTNLAAALLKDFQVCGRRALLLICFADISDMNSEVIGLFEKVYKYPFVNKKLIKNPKGFVKLQNYCIQNRKQVDDLYV